MLIRKLGTLLIILLLNVVAGCGGGVSQSPAEATASDGNNAQNNGGTNPGGSNGTGNPGSPSNTGALTWPAPSTNTDGSSLSDLAGYKLYYSQTPGTYAGYINLGSITTLSLKTLAAFLPASGTYYISMTVYNSIGIESSFSNEIRIDL